MIMANRKSLFKGMVELVNLDSAEVYVANAYWTEWILEWGKRHKYNLSKIRAESPEMGSRGVRWRRGDDGCGGGGRVHWKMVGLEMKHCTLGLDL
ncbi:hypothetical protein M0R45_003943 [Rubus argutus]|uniref:Uncharacterized protein n=1 Tax=Rubus argutus TaxID=59490 RepID=A0AAW1YIK8_RUBAR